MGKTMWPGTGFVDLGLPQDQSGVIRLKRSGHYYYINEARKGWGERTRIRIAPSISPVNNHYAFTAKFVFMTNPLEEVISIGDSEQEAEVLAYLWAKDYCKQRLGEDSKLTEFINEAEQ